MKIILALVLALILSSCGFESKSEFMEDMGQNVSEEKMDFPEIKYISNVKEENRVDFEEIYGKASQGSEVKLQDALGFLKKFNFAGKDVGIEILESSYNPAYYSAVLSYKENDNLIEKEYGPIVTNDNIYSQVNFDLIEAESGKTLLVSQVVIDGTTTKSAYYFYNKYISLIDSFYFENTIDDLDTYVYRMNSLVEAGEDIKTGDIEMAISKRIDKEEEYLDEIFSVYKIEYENIKAEINGRKISVGLMPKAGKNRILEMKFLGRADEDVILSVE